MTERIEISCKSSHEIAIVSTIYSGMTNYVGGTILDESRPPETRRTWTMPDGRFLHDVLDADGCRHWISAT